MAHSGHRTTTTRRRRNSYCNIKFYSHDVKPMCVLCNALGASCKMNFIWLTRNEKMYKKCTEQKNYSKHNCKKTDSVWEHSLFDTAVDAESSCLFINIYMLD